MIKNYFKIAWRNLWKNKGFSAINILGLAIGISTFLVISLYVLDELSFDKHNKKADHIYRLTFQKEGNETWLKDVAAVVQGIARQVPEIENYVRMFPASGLIKRGNIAFNESNIVFSDTSILNIFSLQFLSGNPAQSLKHPNSVVITQSTAKKYFGEKNPVGQQLNLTGNDGLTNFVLTVTAIIKDIPQNSHFHFGFLIPYQLQLASQSNTGVYSYLLLSAKANPGYVTEKINTLQKQYYADWRTDSATKINLQPLTSIHLHSHFFEEIEPNSNLQHIYIFSVTAFLVLLIACINYVNITIAHSTKRAKEVGIRKVLGASKLKIIIQFIIESLVSLVLSLAIALLIINAGLPLINQFTAKSISLELNWNIFLLIPFIMSLCLLSVLYPALILSDFKPVFVLKNVIPAGALKTTTFRKALLFFQFLVAIILLICTVGVYRQLSYIRNKNLGFNKDQVLVIHLRNPETQQLYPILKNELIKNPGIVKVSASHTVPGEEFAGSIYRIPIKTSINNFGIEGFDNNTLFIDETYFDVMGLRLSAGRKFSENYSDVENALIINESAVKEFGFSSSQEAIGKTIEYFVPGVRNFRTAEVVGVINDFHYQSLHTKIEPLIFRLAQPDSTNIQINFTAMITTLSVRIKATNISQTIAQIKNSWQNLDNAYPFEYAFLDEKMNKLYSSDQKLGDIFTWFSSIALLLTFTGLFGISILSIAQRTKEIGIRKALGASVSDIVSMLSKDFLKLVLISALIATPIAWIGMHKWLEDFAYRINLSWWIFALAISIALLITVITVSFQSFKAALANPVKTLRTE